MATTIFEKPVSTEIQTLNDQIGNLGGYFAVVSKEQSTQITDNFVLPYPTGFTNTCFMVGYSVYDNGQWYSNAGLESIYGVSTGLNITPKTSGWTITKIRVLLCKYS